MLVYKTFFKVMKQYKLSLIMYSAIVAFMLIVLVNAETSGSNELVVADTKYTLLVVDNDQSDISKIERGVANPSVATLERIAAALGGRLTIAIETA